MITSLDKFGRVIIPKRLRQYLGIGAGSKINISEEGKRIVIEPLEEKEPIIDKNGILVFTGKIESSPEDFIQNDRRKRMNKLLNGED